MQASIHDATAETPRPPNTAGLDKPPPSNDSIFGRVRRIKSTSSGNADCCKQVCEIFTNSVGFIILNAVSLGVPISMIVMGSLYLGKCPFNRYVPIYLVVAGATCTAHLLVHMLRQITSRKDEESGCLFQAFDWLLRLFDLAWFLFGNWAVYSTWIQKPCSIYQCPEETFCNPSVLLFAFWIITASYILIGCLCIIGLGVFCFLAIVDK